MALVSAGPIVEVTVSPATGFRVALFATDPIDVIGDFEAAPTPGDYFIDASRVMDGGASLLVLLFDDAPGSTEVLEFLPDGMDFTSDLGGAVFSLSGVLLHPQHLNL